MTTQVAVAISLLTVKETAEMLRMSEASLRWHLHTGAAPKSALVAGRRMFRLSDVEAFIQEAFDAE
ncbi:helix-turn-helix domain-containing protein [Leucobacter sp. cx-328]|uniref:helix-turn-helix domain-containing protein n=1 Tax=unclassified Leucobacter TaxID=2621730 RepID=UPI00165DCE90|nr:MULTISPECIES: helix-turn-helix domain-containing protein [unclassified Leucobacter]MBC9943785.1 helix-turn-helix domain-containing protein [Leucobacter sp. cx-328]